VWLVTAAAGHHFQTWTTVSDLRVTLLSNTSCKAKTIIINLENNHNNDNNSNNNNTSDDNNNNNTGVLAAARYLLGVSKPNSASQHLLA